MKWLVDINGAAALESSLPVPQTVTHSRCTTQQSHPQGSVRDKRKRMSPQNLYPNVYSSDVRNSPKVGRPPADEWGTKRKIVLRHPTMWMNP